MLVHFKLVWVIVLVFQTIKYILSGFEIASHIPKIKLLY